MNKNDDTRSKLFDGMAESRWVGIKRTYTSADVLRLRGSLEIEYTIARKGAERLWNLLQTEPYVAALGAMTGNQAVEQVRAGLQIVYASDLQAAGDASAARGMYPDHSLCLSDGVADLVRNINKCLQRADQIHYAEGNTAVRWYAPVVADAAAGFGGKLRTFELMKAMIEAGAAAVHFEDSLPTTKQRSDTGEKGLVPTDVFIEKLIAARLAADVMNVPCLLIAGTGAGTHLSESDCSSGDEEFVAGEKTSEGHLRFPGGIEAAIARGLAYAPYAEVLWYETSAPDLKNAQRFADAIHQQFPGKLLAYNCSPSFNWIKHLDPTTIRNFHVALSGIGYKLQFVTLAGFHSLNLSMFDLARNYRETGMAAYARLQECEFELAESHGYEAVKHERFIGSGYFDDVAKTASRDAPLKVQPRSSPDDQEFVQPALNDTTSDPETLRKKFRMIKR